MVKVSIKPQEAFINRLIAFLKAIDKIHDGIRASLGILKLVFLIFCFSRAYV
jgi:hypothetical protein